jgi:predicted MFS family arabinose efflux permease
MVGVKFIFTHATISFVILAMAAGMFAISCFGPLIAVYVRDELHANSTTFGLINALIGVGMIGGTLLMNRFAKNVSKTHLALWGLLTMGAFVVVLAAFKSVLAASISMFGVGVGVVFVFVSAQTLMQGQTPMKLIGRVSSSVMSVLSLAQLVGLVFWFAGSDAWHSESVLCQRGPAVVDYGLRLFRLPQQHPGQHRPG